MSQNKKKTKKEKKIIIKPCFSSSSTRPISKPPAIVVGTGLRNNAFAMRFIGIVRLRKKCPRYCLKDGFWISMIAKCHRIWALLEILNACLWVVLLCWSVQEEDDDSFLLETVVVVEVRSFRSSSITWLSISSSWSLLDGWIASKSLKTVNSVLVSGCKR